MAIVSAFILADDVVNFPAPAPAPQVPAVVNPQAILRPQFIPGMFSFGFSISIRDVDFTQPIKITMVIKDPEGKQVQEAANIDLAGQKNIPTEIPKEYQAITINISVRNFPVESAGVYHLIPCVNGTELEAQEIPVFSPQKKN